MTDAAKPAARSATLAILTATAILLAACGGPIQRDELERGVQSIASAAADGRLLAEQAARGRLRTTFTRVRARDLASTATHEAEKLSDAHPGPGLDRERREAVELAGAVAEAVSALQVAPDDAGVARATARKLRAASDRGTRLGEAL